MPTTAWERRKALSDRLRGVWDAHRDGRDWQTVYAEARETLAAQMERDAAMVRGIEWDEFMRLQGMRAETRHA